MREEDETFLKMKHDSEIEISQHEEEQGRKKHAARDHSSNVNHVAIVRDDEYRSKSIITKSVSP